MLEERRYETYTAEGWRLTRILQMGAPWKLAYEIAYESDADLHQVLALLRHGASPDEVRRIIL